MTIALLLSAHALAQSIPDTIRFRAWLTVGPFSTAPREPAIDYLVEHGGESTIRPAEGMRHTSILVPGAEVAWTRTMADSTGSVAMRYDSLAWDTLAQYYGTAALMTTSYAYAEFTSDVEGAALALADGVAGFRLNGTVWPGDQYHQHFVRIPVPVRRGTNRLLIKQSGFTGGSFHFELLPAPDPLTVLMADCTLPDAIDGTTLHAPAGITILNTREVATGPITVETGDGVRTERHDTVIAGLIPFSILKVPVVLRSQEPVLRAITGDTLRIPLVLRTARDSVLRTLTVRVRTAQDVRRVTFISAIDGSAQYYGVAPPVPGGDVPGLLLTLHGASVEAQGLAEAYLRKPWAYVVAPTNRRPFGFDWQDWGALDALEVLRDARRRFSIDTNRIWLAGHSMGGHGTWSVGLHHPDLFAAIAPSAGWTSMPLYMPWTFQRSTVYADADVLAARTRALQQDNLLAFTDNAAHLPAFVLHGGSDDNVPVIQARMFVDALRRDGDSVIYKEVPGMNHWWNIASTPGTDCIDDSSMLAFLQAHARVAWPAHVHFHTADLGQSDGAYWVHIDAVEEPFRDAVLDASMDGSRYVIFTANVTAFTLAVPPATAARYATCTLTIDGKECAERPDTQGAIAFAKRDGGFAPGRVMEHGLHKSAASFGPMKQACFHPFVLVYGTAGDSSATAMLMQKARVQAQLWWRIANGTVPILADTTVDAALAATRNLVLFGGPAVNRVTRRYASRLPIALAGDGARIGTKTIGGTHLAAQFVYPNPDHPDHFLLVAEGADAEGESLAGAFPLFASGMGLPDYVIYDAGVRTTGWGGVRAAGFFDTRWQAP